MVARGRRWLARSSARGAPPERGSCHACRLRRLAVTIETHSATAACSQWSAMSQPTVTTNVTTASSTDSDPSSARKRPRVLASGLGCSECALVGTPSPSRSWRRQPERSGQGPLAWGLILRASSTAGASVSCRRGPRAARPGGAGAAGWGRLVAAGATRSGARDGPLTQELLEPAGRSLPTQKRPPSTRLRDRSCVLGKPLLSRWLRRAW